MEDHANFGDNNGYYNCQNLISDPINGKPAVFMYYGGLSPFCPNNYVEGSDWFVQIFQSVIGSNIMALDTTMKIECKGTGSF